MTAIDVTELKTHTEEILRQIQEQGETLDVVVAGRVVARLVPAAPRQGGISPHDAAILEELQQLGEEISKAWPPGLTAEEAIKEQRREL